MVRPIDGNRLEKNYRNAEKNPDGTPKHLLGPEDVARTIRQQPGMTVETIISQAADEFCSNYCKYQEDETDNRDDIEKRCLTECPLNYL